MQATALNESSIGPIITALSAAFPQNGFRLDAAEVPNPFFGLSPATFPDSDQKLLTLVDGGEDGETDPLQPLLVKARKVDTIIAIDAVGRPDQTLSLLTVISYLTLHPIACGYVRQLRCRPRLDCV